MSRRFALILATCGLLAGCTGAAPTPIPSPAVDLTPRATPTPTPMPTQAATPTLAADPVLLASTRSVRTENYQIAVAPVPGLDKATATERATRVGNLVGLGEPQWVMQLGSDSHWLADWPEFFDGIPVDPQYPAIQLEMNADGTVVKFYRTVAPLAPRPAHTITQATARTAAGGKPSKLQLVWAFKPQDSDTLRLVWRVDYADQEWPCAQWLDAGTGKTLEAACVS